MDTNVFEPVAALTDDVWATLKSAKYYSDYTLRAGNALPERHTVRGSDMPFIKARNLVIDAPERTAPQSPRIKLGPAIKWGDPLPRAFFVIAESLVIRLAGETIELEFPYSVDPPRPKPTPPTGRSTDTAIGPDAFHGASGEPPLYANAHSGPPIYIAFNTISFVGPAPADNRWLRVYAKGANGQDGANGGNGGSCDRRVCKIRSGHSGNGGDAAHGFGGGQIFIYAPADAYKSFRDNSQLFLDGGNAGVPGKPGVSPAPAPTDSTPQPGRPGNSGKRGDIFMQTDRDVRELFK
jgi:hypothetical protein